MPEHSHSYKALNADARKAAMAAAEVLAQAKHKSLTPQRRAVYDLLLRAGRPLGAYDLLEQLSDVQDRRVAPPTIYRALEFLQELGVVSRLESSSEFLPCSHPGEPHDCMFLICTCCKKAKEINHNDVLKNLSSVAETYGFTPERQVIEIQGLCKDCR